MKLYKKDYHIAVLLQNLSLAMSAPKNHTLHTGSKMQLMLLKLMLMFIMLTVCHAAKGKSMWEVINVADLKSPSRSQDISKGQRLFRDGIHYIHIHNFLLRIKIRQAKLRH